MPRPKSLATDELDVLDDTDRRFVYELCIKNEQRGMVFDDKGRAVPEEEYKPMQNVLLRSSVSLKKGNEFNKPVGKHLIEYYDGCTSIFSEDHPKDQKTLDIFRQSTREVFFNRGRVAVEGFDTMLKLYMDICSWNENSAYRVPTVNPVFRPVDSEIEAALESENIDLVEKALDLAKKATDKKMLVHAKFLAIDDIDQKTKNPASIKTIRALYRKSAMTNPKEFLRSYNDKSIQIHSWIEKAMVSGEISTTLIPNQAVWAKQGIVICDISGLKGKDSILNKLIEVASSEAGAEFNEHLSALYS